MLDRIVTTSLIIMGILVVGAGIAGVTGSLVAESVLSEQCADRGGQLVDDGICIDREAVIFP